MTGLCRSCARQVRRSRRGLLLLWSHPLSCTVGTPVAGLWLVCGCHSCPWGSHAFASFMPARIEACSCAQDSCSVVLDYNMIWCSNLTVGSACFRSLMTPNFTTSLSLACTATADRALQQCQLQWASLICCLSCCAGCHYSTPGYVVYYLMRSDPQLMLRLQNGRFDAPGAESPQMLLPPCLDPVCINLAAQIVVLFDSCTQVRLAPCCRIKCTFDQLENCFKALQALWLLQLAASPKHSPGK